MFRGRDIVHIGHFSLIFSHEGFPPKEIQACQSDQEERQSAPERSVGLDYQLHRQEKERQAWPLAVFSWRSIAVLLMEGGPRPVRRSVPKRAKPFIKWQGRFSIVALEIAVMEVVEIVGSGPRAL